MRSAHDNLAFRPTGRSAIIALSGRDGAGVGRMRSHYRASQGDSERMTDEARVRLVGDNVAIGHPDGLEFSYWKIGTELSAADIALGTSSGRWSRTAPPTRPTTAGLRAGCSHGFIGLEAFGTGED
jgi:hypothetical protein